MRTDFQRESVIGLLQGALGQVDKYVYPGVWLTPGQ
jgi:hypothetical protein